MDNREKRKTFHRDVEEALSSLLWQPYEYQNKGTSSDTSSYTVSYTSCSSLSSFDLEEHAPSPAQSGNAVPDLHLSEEMVNNLSGTVDQSRGTDGSRDRLETSTASRLHSLSIFSGATARAAQRSSVVGCDVICDEFCENMRLEVPPKEGPSDWTTASLGNLSSANVVGLPRQASVPSNVIFHPRNASEPSNGVFRPGYNHQRHSSHVDNAAAPAQGNVHMRSASVPKSMSLPKSPGESHKPLSIPKPPGEPSSTNNSLHRLQQTRTPLNVSNVNVNFYRAVPVNVVSAVPTIQCDSGGNNVSNVHIMPLSGGASSVPVHASSAVTLNNNVVNTASCVSTPHPTITTQVAVHSSQIPSYSVQVPTSASGQVRSLILKEN